MKSALLVLDVQRIYTDKASQLYCKSPTTTITNINKLIHDMSRRDEMIIFVRHEHKRDGSNLGRLFDFAGEREEDFNFKEGTDEVKYDRSLMRPKRPQELIKDRYSAFQRTHLDSVLRKAGIRKLVICGFMTNFCCESTAREALDRDYYVDFVIDATGTPGTDDMDQKEVRSVVSELLAAGFARVLSTKKFLSEKR